MRRSLLLSAALLLSLFAFPTETPAQPVGEAEAFQLPEPPDAQEAANRLRHLQYTRDFEGGAWLGDQLVKAYPEHLEVWAWYLINRARSNRRKTDAKERADSLTNAHPESPWSWAALAGSAVWDGPHDGTAVAAIDSALARAPDHPDLLWLKSEVLVNEASPEETVEFVDAHLDEVPDPALLLPVKGYALYRISEEDSTVSYDRALEVYERAQRMDSTNVNAFYLPGYQLIFKNRYEEAYPLMKRSARLSTDLTIHTRFWSTVRHLTTKSDSAKEAEIEADIERLRARKPATPNFQFQLARHYRETGDTTRARAIEERLLEAHPRTTSAEWVRIERLRQFMREHREEIESEPAMRDRALEKQWAFLERSYHPIPGLIGDTYETLLHLLEQDSTAHPDTLLRVARGLVDQEGASAYSAHTDGPILLADRGVHLEEAERIARQGFEAVPEAVREDSMFVDTEEEFYRRMRWGRALVHDALGWVYFQQGRLDSAEARLERADSLFDDGNRQNLYHLGKLHAELGRPDEAEQYHAAGLRAGGMGENPNLAALESLYRQRHGDLDGYDRYVANLKETVRAKKREEILAQRIEDPRMLPSFAMEALQRDSVRSDTLADRVAVINFWGVWCGPCRQEMPDLQTLHEKYRDTSDVVLLTVDYRDTPDRVRSYMSRNEFDFPVLIDRGYTDECGIEAYPTTLFVAPSGEVLYRKRGYTDDLVEEFSWRIEALRQEG